MAVIAVTEYSLVVDGHKGCPEWYRSATTQNEVIINISYVKDTLDPVMLVNVVQNENDLYMY